MILQHPLFVSFLQRNDPIFKKHYSKNNIYQLGGTNKITTIYNGEEFKWFEQYENTWFLLNKKEEDCVSVSISSEDHIAFINNINADSIKCGTTILNNQGSHLFKIALQFIKENKKRFNIKFIKLTDTTFKTCSHQEKNNLRIFLTLLTGNTWYGKYGFLPENENKRRDYIYNQNIINTTRLNDIEFNKILESLKNHVKENKITKEQYKYIMDIYNILQPHNPRIHKFLKVIFNKEKFSFICNVFNLIYIKLVEILKIKLEYLIEPNVYIKQIN